MRQKRLLLLLVLLLTAATGAWAAEVTVTKTVNGLFPEVANGTQKATLYSDANLSISVNPDGNNGKVYATGTEWRLYQTNSAVVTVAATEATIKSVAFEFTVKNTGVIKYDGNAMTSGTAVNVNAASAQFVVGNFYDATNGQVIISGFTVVYETTGGASGYTVSLNDGTENPTTWTAAAHRRTEGRRLGDGDAEVQRTTEGEERDGYDRRWRSGSCHADADLGFDAEWWRSLQREQWLGSLQPDIRRGRPDCHYLQEHEQ